jgi:hypothetical protein
LGSPRSWFFEVSTLSLPELVDFRTGYRFSDHLQEFSEADPQRFHSILLEYLSFGGYPRVVIEDEEQEKLALIDEIFSSYLERDIVALLRVEKTEAFARMIRLLAGQTGQLVNFSELATHAGLSVPTVKHFLWYAQKTFVICPLLPYFRNIRKAITKSPCAYFHDLGLRNHAIGRFGVLEAPQELGLMFQNLVFLLLRAHCAQTRMKLNFWRTTDQAKVDFILSRGEEVFPIEVKFQDMKHPRITRSLRNFIERYSPARAGVVNRSFHHTETVGTTRVAFLPVGHLLHGNFLR